MPITATPEWSGGFDGRDRTRPTKCGQLTDLDLLPEPTLRSEDLLLPETVVLWIVVPDVVPVRLVVPTEVELLAAGLRARGRENRQDDSCRTESEYNLLHQSSPSFSQFARTGVSRIAMCLAL